jgi:glycogen(starch) synthase
MRILMLSWEYPPNVVGGLGRHVAELAPALARQGLELHVVTPVSKAVMQGVSVEDGLTVHRVLTPAIDPSNNIFYRAHQINEVIEDYLRRLSQQAGQCDLIHVHDWLTGFAGLALQRAWRCPLVATVHATEKGRNQGHLTHPLQQSIDQAERDLVNQARRVIVCSHHMKNEVQYFFQTADDKLDVIPNGVDLAALAKPHSSQALAAFRANYAAPEEEIIFTVSRLVYEKGVHLLIQAMPLVLEECPRARLIVAGKGPEADNLKLQAEHSGVAGQVSFIGFISDEVRNQFFEVADCAIFASLYEPFGIVALEAMALGCPLIVSDVGGFSEVVKHAETGIKIYPNNVDSTAWGIVHALKHPEWTKKHTAKARRSVQERFNWPRIAALTIDTYRRTLDRSTTGN